MEHLYYIIYLNLDIITIYFGLRLIDSIIFTEHYKKYYNNLFNIYDFKYCYCINKRNTKLYNKFMS